MFNFEIIIDLMKKIKDVKTWLFTNLYWILIVISVILFYVSQIVSEDHLKDILDKAGVAILSSGVFTAILKSFQFTGIFREEISKVMNGTEFLEKRSDILQLWKVISKSLYKSKFPKISDLLEDKILHNYFPTNSSFYYEDYHVSINILSINEKFEIEYLQTCEYNVVCEDGCDSVCLEIYTSISDNDDPKNQITNDLVYFIVDDEKRVVEEDESTISDQKKSLYKVILEGKETYHVKSKYKRKYPLNKENYKLFRMKHLTHGMQVSINFPEYVGVSFFNIGLTSDFSNTNEDFPNHICRINRNDIILPHQGFGMSFEILKKE